MAFGNKAISSKGEELFLAAFKLAMTYEGTMSEEEVPCIMAGLAGAFSRLSGEELASGLAMQEINFERGYLWAVSVQEDHRTKRGRDK